MVLVDTSVWITHLRKGEEQLKALLHDLRVISHPFIVDELACGNIGNRGEVLDLLRALPACEIVTNREFGYFLEQNRLMEKGVGFVDVHIIASAKLAGVSFWTADRKLHGIAREIGISFT